MNRGNLHRDPWFVPPSGARERVLLQQGRRAEHSRQVAGETSDTSMLPKASELASVLVPHLARAAAGKET